MQHLRRLKPLIIKVRQLRRAVSFVFHFVFLSISGHLIVFYYHRKKTFIQEDINRFILEHKMDVNDKMIAKFILLMKNKKYFRNLFYYRIRPFDKLLLPLYPSDKSLRMETCGSIGPGLVLHHPYWTVLNAKSIGKNCTIRHLTTMGNKHENEEYRPIILDNVNIGAGVHIIGNIVIGNNTIIGAGAVVVKNVEDNCVVGGNPAKVLKTIEPIKGSNSLSDK